MSMEVYRKPVRIRLCFEERGVLSNAQMSQGLAKSWYLVNADVLSIGLLAARINHDYRLRESCPQGLVLEMSGFVLPPAQSTRILQDSDLVSVKRKQDGGSGGMSRELATNSLSVDNEEIDHAYRISRGGLIALDEFEKEAGGYQSEHSEDADADFSLGSGKNLRDGLQGRRKLSVKESSGKKRKRSLVPDTQMQIVSPISRKMSEGLDLEPLAVKKHKSLEKKKHKSSEKKKHKMRDGENGSSQILALEGLPRSEHIEGCAKIEKKKKKKMGELVEQTGLDLNNGDIAASEEMNAHEAMESKGREVKGSDGNLLNNESKTEHIDLVEKKQPSRSARRKKAKKRWLREHAQLQNGVVSKKDDAKPLQTEKLDTSDSETSEDAEVEVVLQNGVVPKESDAKSQKTQKMDTSESESSGEDAEAEEVEAEEELLPIKVAPGHIRFERDEDAAEEGRCAPTVVVSYPNVRCKQQGQAWGQEKSQGRYSEEGYYRRSDKIDVRPSHVTTTKQPLNAKFVPEKIDFERLPLLNRAPEVGDLLAYRLVELTASWTPELSSYRVGKVSSHDVTTKMVSVIPVPEYPIHGDEDGQADEDIFLPPYNPDGTLEVNLSTLMEVRVLEEGPHGRPRAVEANTPTQEVVGVNGTTVGVPSEPLQPSTSKVPEENVECGIRMNLNTASSVVSSQHNAEELRSGRDNEAERGPSFTTEAEAVLDGPTDAGWQDMLSEEINKKKLELASRAGNGPERQDCGTDEGQAPTGGVKLNLSKDEGVENGRKLRGTNGAPIIRHRYMRTGALGPTMALLRASQVL